MGKIDNVGRVDFGKAQTGEENNFAFGAEIYLSHGFQSRLAHFLEIFARRSGTVDVFGIVKLVAV